MKNLGRVVLTVVGALVFSYALCSCSSGGGGGTPPASTVAISGTVSAPGGVIAFRRPSAWKSFFAELVGRNAFAAAPGMTPVGSRVTVNLIQIDNNGSQIGPVLATATTDASGNYVLQAPAGFTAASNYVVQAVGSNATLQSFVSGNTADVDPFSAASVLLITGAISANPGATLTQVTAADIAAVLQTLVSFSSDVTTTGTTASQLVANLQDTVANSIDASNIISSLTSTVGITGTVTDNASTPLPNIQILVRTFGDEVTQAITQTDSSGMYTVHVPAGDYVLAAINSTTTSMAASEWWTSGGGTTSQWSAEKVSVGSAMVTKNFTLSPGGRISGSVTAEANGTPLGGINITLRNFLNGQSLMWLKTRTDGSYSFNVESGVYYISAKNLTLLPYATEMYNSDLNGGTSKSQAQRFSISAGSTMTANMSLLAGNKIEGTVTTSGGAPVAGVSIRVQDSTGSFVEGRRTDINGGYRMWLRPAVYSVLVRGQTADVDISGASATQSFAAAVSEITATLIDGSGNLLSQVYAEVYDFSTGQQLGYEVSLGDGSVKVYSSASTSVAIAFKVTNGQPIASSIYLNQTRLGSATSVTSPASLSTVPLPSGAILIGTVTKSGQPAGNVVIQVRSGGLNNGTNSSNRFVATRTMIDGTYTLSLPANTTFDRVCAFNGGALASTCPGTGSGSGSVPGVYAFVDDVAMGAAGSTNTLDFAY